MHFVRFGEKTRNKHHGRSQQDISLPHFPLRKYFACDEDGYYPCPIGQPQSGLYYAIVNRVSQIGGTGDFQSPNNYAIANRVSQNRVSQIDGTGDLQSPKNCAIENRASQLLKEYYILRKKYIKAYDDLMDAQRYPSIDISKSASREILIQALQFWEGKKLKNIAFTIMPNHIHWVFELMKTDMEGKPVYLQDIMQSVKRQSSRQINMAEGRSGSLWHKESFDTTIRDERHLYYAISYTLDNPVKSKLVDDWHNWPGSWYGGKEF